MRKNHFLRVGVTAAIVTLLSGCGTNNSSNPTIPDTTPGLTNTSRGQEIFQERCQACHGLSGQYHKMGAADLRYSVLDSIGVATVIANGRNNMPMFKNVIPDSDFANITQYVMKLRQK